MKRQGPMRHTDGKVPYECETCHAIVWHPGELRSIPRCPVCEPAVSPELDKALDDGEAVEERMTLLERLRNPAWVHGPDPYSRPTLDVDQTVSDMEEAAKEIERLRPTPSETAEPPAAGPELDKALDDFVADKPKDIMR